MAWQAAATIGSSLIGKFGSKSNSAKAAAQQYEYNLALQKQQQEWDEYMYRHRFQMQREDMLEAEINPLFGLGQAPTVTSGLNSTGLADYVGEQNNKVQQFLGALELGQNLSAKRAETKLLKNQADTEAINANLKTIEVMEKNIDVDMKKLQLKYLPERIKAEIKEHLSNSYKNMADAQKSISDINTQKLNSMQTERINKFYEEHPKIGKWITGIGQGREAIFAGLAIGGGAASIANNKKIKNNTARRKARR